MVAYSFNKQFIEPIVLGRKCQTIRAARKRHARAGEDLQLFTGMRTRACRLIGTGLCSQAAPIALWFSKGEVRLGNSFAVIASSRMELDEFAQRDGFDGWSEMRRFWDKAHTESADIFHGWLITWTDFKPSAEFA